MRIGMTNLLALNRKFEVGYWKGCLNISSDIAKKYLFTIINTLKRVALILCAKNSLHLFP